MSQASDKCVAYQWQIHGGEQQVSGHERQQRAATCKFLANIPNPGESEMAFPMSLNCLVFDLDLPKRITSNNIFWRCPNHRCIPKRATTFTSHQFTTSSLWNRSGFEAWNWKVPRIGSNGGNETTLLENNLDSKSSFANRALCFTTSRTGRYDKIYKIWAVMYRCVSNLLNITLHHREQLCLHRARSVIYKNDESKSCPMTLFLGTSEGMSALRNCKLCNAGLKYHPQNLRATTLPEHLRHSSWNLRHSLREIWSFSWSSTSSSNYMVSLWQGSGLLMQVDKHTSCPLNKTNIYKHPLMQVLAWSLKSKGSRHST